MAKEQVPIQKISAGSSAIELRNVSFGAGILVDELTLDADALEFTPGNNPTDCRYSSSDIRFRAMATEANLNRILAEGITQDSAVKNLKVVLFTGRAQFKGHLVKSVMSIPFTLDAKPVLIDGIRLKLDCSSTQIGGIGLPGAIVDLIEKVLNEKLSLDLTDSPVPIKLEEVRCEPGRLTVTGSLRLNWPPVLPPAIDPVNASP